MPFDSEGEYYIRWEPYIYDSETYPNPVTLVTMKIKFAADVKIAKDGLAVDAKSVLELLMLAAECGSELVVEADGLDAEGAVDALRELIESRFGEHEVDAH